MIVQARDAKGTVVAELRPGHPCRATIGPIEMLIGGPPLVAQVGETRWTGRLDGENTEYMRDGLKVGGMMKIDSGLKIYDFDHAPDALTVTRDDHAQRDGAAIVVGDIAITGTDDFVLAAALVARELRPEIRMLAACERVLR